MVDPVGVTRDSVDLSAHRELGSLDCTLVESLGSYSSQAGGRERALLHTPVLARSNATSEHQAQEILYII